MKNEDQESFVIPLDLRTKHEILNEYNTLINLYSKYRKYEREGQDYTKGKMDWLVQIEKMYLRLKSDLIKAKNNKYDKLVDLMDGFIQGKDLTFEESVNCTIELISFVNYLGLSRISIFKKSFAEKLEDEM